jgi:Uma2 family endonuclease
VALAEHSVVQPDVVFFARRPEGISGARLLGVPDLLVEVLSPATQRRDRGDKLKLYAESSVPEYWIVDPESRQIEFLVNRGGEYAVALPLDGVYRSALTPGLHLELEPFWAEVEQFLG